MISRGANCRRRAQLALLLTMVLACFSQFSPAQNAASPKPAPKERAEAFIHDFMQKNSIPGAVAAVAHAGDSPWIAAFGEADIEQHVPVRPETVFRIGSVTKLLTAEAVVLLAKAGKLDLDADIRQYVPSFPAKEFSITARQLAGHLAGIHHYGRSDFLNSQRQRSVAENLTRFENDPLLHPPGSKYLYSSYGYVLLGAVIEGAGKQDYLSYVTSAVLKPLAMEMTVPDFNDDLVPWRARPYSKRSDGTLMNGPYMDSSDRLAAGAFASTAGDLLKFGLAHLRPGLMPEDSYHLLFTPQKTTSGQETGVGFAWRIGEDSKGRTIYHHGGESVGGRAFLLIYPEDRLVVVFLCNLSFAPFDEKTAEALADIFR